MSSCLRSLSMYVNTSAALGLSRMRNTVASSRSSSSERSSARSTGLYMDRTS